MINILYCIPSLSTSGGMERVLVEKSNFLISSGNYNVFIVTTDMLKNSKSFFGLNNKVNLLYLDLNYNNLINENFWQKMREIKKLNKIYKKNIKNIVHQYSIDICITMGGKELEFLGDLNLPCKTIYESHFNKDFRSSFLLAHGKQNFFWKIFGKFRDFQHDFQAKKLDKIVVLTKASLKEWGENNERLILIQNPSPLINKFKKIPELDSKRVITIGKLDVQKGHDMLIKAWSLISYKYKDWKLDIYGQGQLKEALQDEIEKLGLQTSVTLAGITRDVEKELYGSSFFVMSSRFEGLPMVLIESITCGLPIISFDCETGPREIIVNNDCGLLVKNGNVEELALAIEKLILNRDLRYEKSLKAIEKSKIYELEYIMKKWDNLFLNLVG